MADIAILVAEEYERRLKDSRKRGEDIELMSCLGFMGQNLKGYSWNIKEEFVLREQKLVEDLRKNVLQPKSQMSVAASNGFFSA